MKKAINYIKDKNNSYKAGVVTKAKKVNRESKQKIAPNKEAIAMKKKVITERDREIIGLINRFGFITADRLSQVYRISESRIRRRLKILCDYGFLKHERILHAYPGAYWATREGKELSDSLLTPIRIPRFATFEHELSVFDVFIDFKTRYEDSFTWITARELMSNQMAEARNTKEAFKLLKTKIPDALVLRGDKKFAIEVELSVKGLVRLKKILSDYNTNLAKGVFDGVLYYTDKSNIEDRLENLIKQLSLAERFRILRIKKTKND